MYDYSFKVVFLGDDSAGRTAFINRVCTNLFRPDLQMTLGVDFYSKTYELLGKVLKFQLWDFAGEERFRFLVPTYCRGANAAVLMYDITKPSTLVNISEWLKIIRANSEDIPIMLIGSSLYSEDTRAITVQEGIAAAQDYDLSAFGEVCAETGKNIEEIFNVLGKLLVEEIELYGKPRLVYPSPIGLTRVLKINKYLELRLEGDQTNIYVGGKLYNRCKYLLLNMVKGNDTEYEDIESIDEASEKLSRSMEGRGSQSYIISPETEFWGHCSNIQAWYENNYDTRILHRNLAFPLLTALVKEGDNLAKRVFKEELARRLESGYRSVVYYLLSQGYLKYLTKEEFNTIIENPAFIKNLPKWYVEDDTPKWLSKRIKAMLSNLKCTYCGTEIPDESIQRFLKRRLVRCELCYTDLLKDL